MIRRYSELRRLETFEERFRYLSLGGRVGVVTFGFDRWINQQFYRSREWKHVRHEVIVRDDGCDLGHRDYPINSQLLIHHMNPVELKDIVDARENLLNPEFLICVTHRTHNAIHYGDESQLPKPYVERTRGDTKLW